MTATGTPNSSQKIPKRKITAPRPKSLPRNRGICSRSGMRVRPVMIAMETPAKTAKRMDERPCAMPKYVSGFQILIS